MFAGQIMLGAMVSCTVTVKVQVLVLCAASKAVQITVVLPRAKVLPLAGEQVGVSAPSTMSLALAVKVAIAPEAAVASTVMLGGQVTAGGVVSWTVTVKVQLPVLLCASVDEQVTVVVP